MSKEYAMVQRQETAQCVQQTPFSYSGKSQVGEWAGEVVKDQFLEA